MISTAWVSAPRHDGDFVEFELAYAPCSLFTQVALMRSRTPFVRKSVLIIFRFYPGWTLRGLQLLSLVRRSFGRYLLPSTQDVCVGVSTWFAP